MNFATELLTSIYIYIVSNIIVCNIIYILFIYRNKFCVKEDIELQQDLCGRTQYFGDEYVDSKCQFKMCSDTCIPGQYSFLYGGVYYSRTTHCCSDADYCNSGNTFMKLNSIFSMSSMLVVCCMCCISLVLQYI